ncbi:hypothetical protein [Spirillospora sp. NPDC047279]|uniref:hypothetical protein n=1 Tax=Spirillospora sp. NPDC047279 TaxID=3155478 RepID=UPI003406DA97
MPGCSGFPWYEALLFPLVALAPASRLDWLQLARTLVATIGALPGVVMRLGDSWLRSAVETGPPPDVVPVLLLLLAVSAVRLALPRVRPPPARGSPVVPGLRDLGA